MQPSDRIFHVIKRSQTFKHFSPFPKHCPWLARVRLNDEESGTNDWLRRSEPVRFGGDIVLIGDHRESQRSDADSPEPDGDCVRYLRALWDKEIEYEKAKESPTSETER